MGYVFPGLVIEIHLRKQPERQLAQLDNPLRTFVRDHYIQPHFQKMIDYLFVLLIQAGDSIRGDHWLLPADIPILLLPIMH